MSYKLGFGNKRGQEEVGIVSQEDAIRKKAGLEMLIARLHASSQLRQFTVNKDKEGHIKQEESYASQVSRLCQEASVGMGQMGGKAPIGIKNLRAFDRMLLRLEHFQHEYGNEHDITTVQAEMVARAAVSLISRSIYPRDADVQVAKIDTGGDNWKQNEDTLED